MYEHYTDKQIVEMLKPKLAKLGWGKDVTNINIYPSTCKMIATIYRSAYIRGQLGRSFIIGDKNKQDKQTEHWVTANKNNVKVGSKVRMIDEEAHENHPQWFPVVGTVGIVEKRSYNNNCKVQWSKGTTSIDDKWFCDYGRLEVLLCE